VCVVACPTDADSLVRCGLSNAIIAPVRCGSLKSHVRQIGTIRLTPDVRPKGVGFTTQQDQELLFTRNNRAASGVVSAAVPTRSSAGDSPRVSTGTVSIAGVANPTAA
jgi:hypothetical protein